MSKEATGHVLTRVANNILTGAADAILDGALDPLALRQLSPRKLMDAVNDQGVEGSFHTLIRVFPDKTTCAAAILTRTAETAASRADSLREPALLYISRNVIPVPESGDKQLRYMGIATLGRLLFPPEDGPIIHDLATQVRLALAIRDLPEAERAPAQAALKGARVAQVAALEPSCTLTDNLTRHELSPGSTYSLFGRAMLTAAQGLFLDPDGMDPDFQADAFNRVAAQHTRPETY